MIIKSDIFKWILITSEVFQTSNTLQVKYLDCKKQGDQIKILHLYVCVCVYRHTLCIKGTAIA
jgi:hypothetical protein